MNNEQTSTDLARAASLLCWWALAWAVMLSISPTAHSASREIRRSSVNPSSIKDVVPKRPITLSLPDAILIGLRKNPQIRSAYLQRISDRFALYVAEQAFNPQTSLEMAVIRSRTNGSNSSSFLAAPSIAWSLPTGATFSAGLTNSQNSIIGQPGSAFSQLSFQAIQPLLRGAGREVATSGLQLSRIQERINKLTLATAVNDAITQIIVTYRSVVIAQNQMQIANESLKRSKALLEINQELISAGRMAKADLLQSQLGVTQQELFVATAKGAYETSKDNLLIMVGLDLGSSFEVEDKRDIRPIRIDEDRAFRVALEHQPNYLAELLSIEIGRIDLLQAKDQRRWNLSVLAGGGQQASGTGAYQSFRDVTRSKTDYIVGLQLSIPLSNHTAEQREVNASISLQQAEIRVSHVRDQVVQSVRQSVRGIEIQERALQSTSRAKNLARQQLDIEIQKLQAGRSSNFQVVSFQNALQAAESAESLASFEYLNALTDLDRILGSTLDTWKIDLGNE